MTNGASDRPAHEECGAASQQSWNGEAVDRGRHPIAAKRCRTHKKGGGKNAHDEPVDAGFQPPVLEVNIKLATFHVVQDVSDILGEDRDQSVPILVA